MLDYEKFKLTQEDIDSGIQDFFTQLLIEAKKQKINAKKLEDLSSQTPTVSYLIGQPGSGKTSLGKHVLRQYVANSECAVEVGSDKIATYHRDYSELIKLLPDDCYTISRQFVRPAEPIIYGELRKKKINILQEASFDKGERDYSRIEEFKKAGYNIQINIMAVDKYESFLSCIERDIKLLELGYDPRPVARMNHDRMYTPFLQELMEMEKRGLLDEVNVYARGKTFNIPSLVYTTGSNSYSNVHEAILYERMKSRKNLLNKPQQYLSRLHEAKNMIELMVQDEMLKKNYIDELEDLEREFINELSFDRNIH